MAYCRAPSRTPKARIGELGIKSLFARGHFRTANLVIGLSLISLTLIIIDSSSRWLQPVRSAIDLLTAPIIYVAEVPHMAAHGFGRMIVSRAAMLEQIDELTQRNLQLSQSSQQAEALRAENDQMRTLLGSKPRTTDPVLIAEIVGVTPISTVHQVVIDKGSADGVRTGYAVLDSEGLFGQVLDTSPFNARVLMITDSRHGLPVEAVRNGLRGVAYGTGQIDRLHINGLPLTAEIRGGDRIVASGLGQVFPYGYPVGVVESVHPSPSRNFALVNVRPSAQLDRARHILVILKDVGEEQP